MKLCKDCKNQGSKSICQYYGSGSNYAERCKYFGEVKQTNADRIRSMSDEELAEWLHNISQFESDGEEPMISIYNLNTQKDEVIHDSYGDLLNWLQSEVGDE